MSHAQTAVKKESLSEEFQTVVAQTEQLLSSIASAGNERAGALKSGVGDALLAAVERLAKIRERAMAQACASARATDDYVKADPWRAIGIFAGAAAVAGLAAGLLIARR